MDETVKYLNNYIWKNGFEKLSENPFDVYLDMVRGDKGNPGVDPRTGRLVLVTLLSRTHEMARKGCSADEIIHHIQSEHFVNKKTAKELASLYLDLFSDDNKRLWNDAKEIGFDEFCGRKWTVEWKSNCDWYTKHGGSYPCDAEATLMFAVRDKESLHRHLSSDLKKNPFLSSDDIYRILRKQIEANLDDDLEAYCDADDYYEPYLEEFVSEGTYESEEKWVSWGLEIIEFTGSGSIDFER